MIDLASQHLRKAARDFPERTAIVQGGRELSWAEFDRAVDKLALRLVAAGLEVGQRVMIVGENSPEYLIICFGVWRAGGVMAVVHASFGPAELDYALANAEPRFLFVEDAYRDGVAASVARSDMPVQIFELAAGVEPLGDSAPFADELPSVNPAALGIIGYTSGTTGRPKPVAHSHRTIARGTSACATIWRVDANDTLLVSMPLSWLAGLIILAVTATTCGAKIHLLRRFSADDALDAMVDHGVTFIFAATSMYAKIVNAWRQRTAPRPFHLRCCISGGEARNEAVFKDWRAITGTPVLDSYGASECWPFVTHDPGIAILPPPGSAGKLVEGAKIRLLDADGNEVAEGEVGEAQGLAPCMMLSYWNEPQLTAKAITPDGWYRTGDYARVDEQGYVYILGRTVDLIVTGGQKVYPVEVEQVLSELDDVAQAAVVGLADDACGQAVAAAVVLMPGAAMDVATLRAHCASRLQRHKVPVHIAILRDLPHNASGKIVRRDLIPILQRLSQDRKAMGQFCRSQD